MKRWIAGILCIAMLLSLLAGCGAPAEETQAAAETVMQTETPTEPTTEPTIDPEELFLQSLPADVRRAYEVGLVTREDLNDLERSVTVGEAALILQKAQTHRAGTESPVLADLMTHETFAQRNADRGWLMGIPALIDLEQAYASRFESYEQWTQEVLKIQYGALELHYAFSARLGMSVYMTGEKTLRDKKSVFDLTYNADGDEYLLSAWDVIMGNAPDGSVYEEGADALYVKDPQMLSYALELHDGTTGKKFMQMEKAEFEPFRELTFGEVVESALRLYNAPNPVAWPEFVAVEEVGAYNTDIITADLLNKETDLPAASCEKLPSNWHGVVFNDLQTIGIDTMHQDAMVYEYEIQAVKDAGFNYIGLYLDFSWLQDYILFESKRVAFGSILNNQDKGKISMERLEQLDQILAWCMERDIHVNLRACSLPNINQDTHMGLGYQLDMNGKNYASILAAMWQAIARRYADLPTEYLSFTLLSTVSGEDAATLLPSVDAIREESPDRCIIAEMHSFQPQAEAFAQKGVALSSRLFDYEGVSPFLNHSECTQWDSKYRTNFLPDKCLDTIRSFTWPYNGIVDATALFSYRLYSKIPSTMDVINTAREYGVGCMLSDFGVRINEWGSWDGMSLPRFRYPLDAYKAMIQDIVTSAEDLELGWCFAYWYSPYGVAFGTPLFDDTTYTQVEDYPYYIDQTILGWFQEINSKSGTPGRLLPHTNGDLATTIFPDSTFLLADKDGAKIEAYRAQAAERKEAIVNSKTSIVKADTFVPGETYSGKAYYVSPDGDDSNDGLTPETAWKTTNAVTDAHYSNKLKKGDAVFFRRGATYRVDPCKSLAVHEGVTYSAYGEGDKPILTLSEGNKADPGFWELYYDQNGMKIWKYHQQITDVGGIVFNDSSYATRVFEWPDNGKWQAVDIVKKDTGDYDSRLGANRVVGTGEYRKVEENMPENLTYISRVDISGASYPINFVENPKTGMPYTGELYLRCDEGNPGEVFDEIAILGYSDVSKGSWFQIITAFDVDDFVLDNLCVKYYVDTAVCGGLKAENVVIQNCVVGWGGNRIHTVTSPEPTADFFNIGDGIYCIANNATIRNNYMYMSANGCTFENGPMGYEKDMGVYTCTGNLMENCAEGIRAYLFELDEGDVPFEKMVIQDNIILDTGVSINNGNNEIPAAIDISEGDVFAKEILVSDNICIGSTQVMVRMGNPMYIKETYRNNVWAHDPKLPIAAMMNPWGNTWVSMDGAK